MEEQNRINGREIIKNDAKVLCCMLDVNMEGTSNEGDSYEGILRADIQTRYILIASVLYSFFTSYGALPGNNYV